MLTLILIGLLGGLITGVSPCVLPMLPVIFFAGGTTGKNNSAPAVSVPDGTSHTGGGGATTLVQTQPPAKKTRRSRRPLKIIAGLILSFSVFTLAGSFLLSVLHLPQDFLRWAGLVVLSIIGIGLIFPKVEEIIQRPFYRLPKMNRRGTDGNAFVLGLGLGTLYVPCAGPVLAAITVAGASGRVDARIVALTVAFALGVAIPLFFFALAGDKIGRRLTAYRSRARKFRISGGVLMLALAVALAFNLTAALQRAVPDYTQALQNQVENNDAARGALTGLSDAGNSDLSKCTPGSAQLADCGAAPAIEGITAWFNTPGNQPLALSSLKGKVVLIDFWTYSCINCQRTLPYVEAWNATYQKAGLQVIGIHTPEFAFEKVPGNVANGISSLGVKYPVAMDNSAATWTNYRNSYWPAEYLIDATGTVRHIEFGEGNYAQTEGLIRQLLTEANPSAALPAPTSTAAPTGGGPTTPETYLAYSRSQNYVGATPLLLRTASFAYPATQPNDTYGLTGSFAVTSEAITSNSGAGIRINYQATHIYAVLGGSGTVPIVRNGATIGSVSVSGAPRLYPLYTGATDERATLELKLPAGIQAYTFTFG